MGFAHWFHVPLSESKWNLEGNMKRLDLSSSPHSTTSDPCRSHLQSPDSGVRSRKELPDIELFKILIKNQCEKLDILKESVLFLQTEIEGKNKTIDKLTSFIINVIEVNFECLPNEDEHSKVSRSKSSTPNKYDKITIRRKTKSQGGFPDNNGLSFNGSDSLNNVDFESLNKDPLQYRMAQKLANIRR